jgi:hypothetical protein
MFNYMLGSGLFFQALHKNLTMCESGQNGLDL